MQQTKRCSHFLCTAYTSRWLLSVKKNCTSSLCPVTIVILKKKCLWTVIPYRCVSGINSREFWYSSRYALYSCLCSKHEGTLKRYITDIIIFAQNTNPRNVSFLQYFSFCDTYVSIFCFREVSMSNHGPRPIAVTSSAAVWIWTLQCRQVGRLCQSV